ncbi:glutathione S-transferase family protein [uncultured Ferrovibrio sp.]|jgi:glutathione S-transferase|uniref:glutathione S-transferase family protein n=1 Tax=uncultured Ferrovibrio sp. TaxID=1576913 RepID=UPI0026335D55|nr:glutathione S-transferase family protein [uncultured Ferrovibrio sp.]
MYKLFWAPGTAAMAPQAVLEEIGAPYEAVQLDLEARQHEQAEYKTLNPNGRIPTLIDGDFVIFETAAICQYLCDRHPEANLVPLGGHARGRFYQWLTYMTNTVQVAFTDWFHPDWTFSALDSQAALKAQAEVKLERCAAVLDAGIGESTYMIGTQYTVCDIYLAMLARWSRFQPKPMWHWPNIKRVVAATYTRPAFQRMLQKQGIAWAENWPRDE